MASKCRSVVHTSAGPTKNCARWVWDDVSNQAVRRGVAWFKSSPGPHKVVVTSPSARPPEKSMFQPDALLPEGAILVSVQGGRVSGRSGRSVREHFPNPDLGSLGVRALLFSPYHADLTAFLAARSKNLQTRVAKASWSLGDGERDEAIDRYPALVLDRMSDVLSVAEVEKCALHAPAAALRRCPGKLSLEQFSRSVLNAPDAALNYCAERLSPTQLSYCASKEPILARLVTRLQKEAASFSDADVDRVVHVSPVLALRYFPERLTNDHLVLCVAQHPEETLRFAKKFLFESQVRRCQELA